MPPIRYFIAVPLNPLRPGTFGWGFRAEDALEMARKDLPGHVYSARECTGRLFEHVVLCGTAGLRWRTLPHGMLDLVANPKDAFWWASADEKVVGGSAA